MLIDGKKEFEWQERERKNLIDRLIEQVQQFVDENKDPTKDDSDEKMNSGKAYKHIYTLIYGLE